MSELLQLLNEWRQHANKCRELAKIKRLGVHPDTLMPDDSAETTSEIGRREFSTSVSRMKSSLALAPYVEAEGLDSSGLADGSDDAYRVIARMEAKIVAMAWNQPDKASTVEVEAVGAVVSLDERALALFVTHRDWTKKEIAESLPCNAKSLTPKRCPLLNTAIQAYKASNLPSGSKSKDGDMEAWD